MHTLFNLLTTANRFRGSVLASCFNCIAKAQQRSASNSGTSKNLEKTGYFKKKIQILAWKSMQKTDSSKLKSTNLNLRGLPFRSSFQSPVFSKLKSLRPLWKRKQDLHPQFVIMACQTSWTSYKPTYSTPPPQKVKNPDPHQYKKASTYLKSFTAISGVIAFD